MMIIDSYWSSEVNSSTKTEIESFSSEGASPFLETNFKCTSGPRDLLMMFASISNWRASLFNSVHQNYASYQFIGETWTMNIEALKSLI